MKRDLYNNNFFFSFSFNFTDIGSKVAMLRIDRGIQSQLT